MCQNSLLAFLLSSILLLVAMEKQGHHFVGLFPDYKCHSILSILQEMLAQYTAWHLLLFKECALVSLFDVLNETFEYSLHIWLLYMKYHSFLLAKVMDALKYDGDGNGYIDKKLDNSTTPELIATVARLCDYDP